MNFIDITNLPQLQRWMLFHHKDHKVIYIIGLLVVLSFILHNLTKKFKLPSVVGYILIGILFSTSIIEKLPFVSAQLLDWYTYLINSFSYVTILAVSFISFTIGTELSLKVLKRLELEFTLIVLLESFGAFGLVTGGMLLLGKPLPIAIILGSIATATAPAATVMVLKEYGSGGKLSATLMIVLALDEAIALIIFSFVEPITLISYSPEISMNFFNVILIPMGKIIGAIVIGLLVGYFSQKLMLHYTDKYDKVLLILATIFGMSALSLFLDFSPLIANLAVGFAYRNFAKKRLNIAGEIDTITIPLYAIFFILAGTRLQITSITKNSFLIIAMVYTLARIIGKVGGASLGAKLSKAPRNVCKYIGFGLLPQIGVDIDLAYILQRDFVRLSGEAANLAELVFNIILFTTIITEIFGPLATEYALSKSGEIKKE